MWLLQNLIQLPEIGDSSFLQLVSFFGILLTIAISYSSFNLQRNAAARESLEQLDDITLPHIALKIRPILHRYSNILPRKAVVKLKLYRPSSMANVSEEVLTFYAFPGYIFEDYEVETDRDGYYITIPFSNPIKIRRIIDELLLAMYEEGRNRDQITNMNHQIFFEHYSGALDGEEEIVHRKIKDCLERHGAQKLQPIEVFVSEEDIPKGLVSLALRDLIAHGVVREDEKNGEDVYSLAEGE